MPAPTLTTALAALALATLAVTAAAGEITGNDLVWKPYWHATCKMRLDRAYQAAKDAPITIVVTNTATVAVEFKLMVRTTKDYRGPTKEELSVNSTAPGQTRTLKTKAYAGTFDGGTLYVEYSYCKPM